METDYQLAEPPIMTSKLVDLVRVAARNTGINIGRYDGIDSFYSDQPDNTLVAGRWLKWNPLVKGRADQTLWLARKLQLTIEFRGLDVVVTDKSGKVSASSPYSVYDEEYALATAVLTVAFYM